MDHDGADCAELLCLFEFVSPATVIGTRRTPKERFSLFVNLRIVVEKQKDLAAQVLILEVIPIILRRLNAVAYENDRCVSDIDNRLFSR